MRRIIRTLVGSIVLLAGVVMRVLPGPALIVIPLGLAILRKGRPYRVQALLACRPASRRPLEFGHFAEPFGFRLSES